MKAKFLQNKNLRCYVQPQKGSFALDSSNIVWEHCREQFTPKLTKDVQGFYFVHSPNKSEDIAEFLTKFEIILGVQNTSRFAKTSKNDIKNDILWLEPSSFWMNCYMKRSLLTILLRCGTNYIKEKDNFDNALFDKQPQLENEYAIETKPAILRFMFGFTLWTGIPPYHGTVQKHGWREEFYKTDQTKIRSLLILPKEEVKEEITMVGLESLWL